MSGDREAVARLVDPEAFEPTHASYPYQTQDQEAAFAKADQILAALRVDGGEDREVIIERCAVAAEQQDRTGREWVKDSLWDAILRRAGQNVRALKASRINDR